MIRCFYHKDICPNGKDFPETEALTLVRQGWTSVPGGLDYHGNGLMCPFKVKVQDVLVKESEPVEELKPEPEPVLTGPINPLEFIEGLKKRGKKLKDN